MFKEDETQYCKNCYELQEQLDQLKETNKDLLSIQYKLADNNKQLRQTLTKIKEIAEDFYKTGFVRTDCGATLINNNTCIKTLEQILQKISECEVGDKIKTVDLGFWDKDGKYIEDIQTVDITKE